MSKKKIAIFNYDNSRGGAADSYRRILNELSQANYDIMDLVAFPSTSFDTAQNLFIKRPKIMRLLDKAFFILGFESYKFPNIPNIPTFRKLRNQDIIILFNLHGGSMSVWDILWFKFFRRSAIVLRTSDIYWITGRCAFPSSCEEYKNKCINCEYLQEYPAGKRKFLYFDLQIKKTLFNYVVDVIATPSNWIERLYKIQYPNKKYIHVRNSYAPVSDLKSLQESMRQKSDKFTIIFCASHLGDKRKGFNLLAQLLVSEGKIFDKFKFIILGEYDAAFKKKHLLLFEEHDIKFVGHCTKKELEEWYSSGDIYLHLSYSDNFPNTILLAHSLALPIICIDVGGVAELMSIFNSGCTIELCDQNEMRLQLAMKIREMSENYIVYKKGANDLSNSLATYCTELEVLSNFISEC